MKTVVVMTTALLLGSTAAQGEEIACYNCRTRDCPELQAPLCASASEKKPTRKHATSVAVKPTPAEVKPAPEVSPPLVQEVKPEAPIQAPPPSEDLKPPALEIRPAPPPEIKPVAPPPAPATHRLRGPAIGVGIGGLVLAGAGAGLLAINGGYATCSSGTNNTCQHIWTTGPVGGTLIGVGGAALVTATVLLVLDARHRPERAAALHAPLAHARGADQLALW